MKLVSPLLKHFAYPALSSCGFLRHYARHGHLCVVTYHGVSPAGYSSVDPVLDGGIVSTEVFQEQIRWLKSRYNVVSPEAVREWINGTAGLIAGAVLLTCDDGLENTVSEMLPVLQRENVSCLFFVTASSATSTSEMLWYEELYLMLIDARPERVLLDGLNLKERFVDRKSVRGAWWRIVGELSSLDEVSRRSVIERVHHACGLPSNWMLRYSSDEPQRQRFFRVNKEGLKALHAAGMGIGSHTISHPLLPQMAEQDAWAEIAQSAHIIEDQLGCPIWAFAYPFGDRASVGNREIEMVKRAGYQCAFVNYDGGFVKDVARFAIPRVHVTADMGLAEFDAHVSGFHTGLRRRAGR